MRRLKDGKGGLVTPTTPSRAFTDECARCRTPMTGIVQLEHDTTGDRITICPRCLRSTVRLKADVGDPRARILLSEYAAEHAWDVWRSDHVAYVLPRWG